MGYLTPDTLPTTFICRRLRLPDDLQWLEIMNGAISSLLKESAFEAFGAVTPQQCVEIFTDIFVEYLEGEPCLIGAILPYATLNPPEGALECDGATYARTDYPALYAALDTIYIVDSDTFTVPDLRGRAVIGTGTGSDLTARAMGDTGGEETHELSVAELATHAHDTTPHSHSDAGHVHGYTYPTINLDLEGVGVPDVLGAGNPPIPLSTTVSYANLSSETVAVSDTGESTPHENMPPFHALRYCIVSR